MDDKIFLWEDLPTSLRESQIAHDKHNKEYILII